MLGWLRSCSRACISGPDGRSSTQERLVARRSLRKLQPAGITFRAPDGGCPVRLSGKDRTMPSDSPLRGRSGPALHHRETSARPSRSGNMSHSTPIKPHGQTAPGPGEARLNPEFWSGSLRMSKVVQCKSLLQSQSASSRRCANAALMHPGDAGMITASWLGSDLRPARRGPKHHDRPE
jgi:hypothetical protein